MTEIAKDIMEIAKLQMKNVIQRLDNSLNEGFGAFYIDKTKKFTLSEIDALYIAAQNEIASIIIDAVANLKMSIDLKNKDQ
jgi:hypothetical protein